MEHIFNLLLYWAKKWHLHDWSLVPPTTCCVMGENVTSRCLMCLIYGNTSSQSCLEVSCLTGLDTYSQCSDTRSQISRSICFQRVLGYWVSYLRFLQVCHYSDARGQRTWSWLVVCHHLHCSYLQQVCPGRWTPHWKALKEHSSHGKCAKPLWKDAWK